MPALESVVERATLVGRDLRDALRRLCADLEAIPALVATRAEFVALGDAVWSHPDGPAKAVAAAMALIGEQEARRLMRNFRAARDRAGCRAVVRRRAGCAGSRLWRLPARPLHQAFREATLRLEKDKTDAAAMTLLGELYNQGLGVPASPAKAAEWYRLAAARGDAQALSSLGMMALDGRGMERESRRKAARGSKRPPRRATRLRATIWRSSCSPAPAEADVSGTIALLRVAADAELPDAQHALGVLYLKGRGVARDPTEAASLFERAAQNGSQVGEVEYAILLFNGDGVPRNESKAAHYFRRAAAKGNAIAQNRLARLLSPDAACRSTRWTRPPGIFWPPHKGFPIPGSTMR